MDRDDLPDINATDGLEVDPQEPTEDVEPFPCEHLGNFTDFVALTWPRHPSNTNRELMLRDLELCVEAASRPRRAGDLIDFLAANHPQVCRQVPLVYQAFNWSSGVYAGATMGSETTAAAAGATGNVRRDPMAMLPFCGYNMGDHLRHWLLIQRGLKETPRIFHVNWFRKDANGRFLWPGFSENMRILKWAVDRVHGRARSEETPLGWTPRYEDICWDGLPVTREQYAELEHVDRATWHREVIGNEELFLQLHDHLLPELIFERELLIRRL